MKHDNSKIKDAIALMISNLDQLQADIDWGRIHYKDNADIQRNLDEAQAQVDESRDTVKIFQQSVERRS